MKTHQMFDEINELKQRIKDFDSLVSSIDDIIFEVSDQGVILNCWTANPEQLYYDKNFLINKSVKELFPTEFSNTIMYIIEKSIRKRTGYILKYKSPFDENHEHWYRLKTKIISNKFDRLTVVITNITREQKLLSKIQIKEEKFNRAFQNSSIGMLLLSKSLKVIEYNLELQHILGYNEPEEMLKKEVPEFILESHHENVQIAFDEVKHGLREKAMIEAECYARGNKVIWCLINISSVRDQLGKVVYFLCQIQDLSLFKSNETKLNHQNELLEKINYELKVKINQLETFNQILAHNLRTPISNIEMIINQLEIETSQEQKNILIELLRISNKKFLNLFDNLIETIDVQNSNKNLSQTTQIEDVISKIKSYFAEEISTNKLHIIEDFQAKVISFPGDYIFSIFKYLISSSLKTYVPGKLIEIIARTNDVENNILISLENNCSSQHCFEIASETLNSIKAIDENFEMELHIAKQQIYFFGGNIKIFRIADVGNKVIISLPKSF